VYLAGPFFTLAQLWLVEQARADLTAMGLRVFSPYHDVGHGSAEDVVMLDLAGIDTADLVFAIGDGMDSGTVYEIGYARAKGKPVVMYAENESDENKKMMRGSGCVLHDDYVSAIYETLWTACAL
jgi:nucleoside 2-deoxyribosyltransferase